MIPKNTREAFLIAMMKKIKIKELKIITSQQTIFSFFADVLIKDFANSFGNFSGNVRPETATTVMAIISPKFSMDPKNIKSEIMISDMTLIINGRVNAQ